MRFLGGMTFGAVLMIVGFAFGQATETFTAYVNGLSAASSLTGPEAIPVIQSGTAKQTTPNAMGTLSAGWFNVRLQYGGVPDGSTDNSTAITNAFTASNAFTSGVATVYFDCNPNTTTCTYKYGGSGTSPINPTVPTTILCAPGVTLKYTGTAHAADIGSGSNSTNSMSSYTVQGCQWTGGASMTEGVVLANLVTNPLITGNTFLNFGPSSPSNTTAAALYFAGSNFQPVITNNRWIDTDGVPRNALDSHNSANSVLYFAQNSIDCQNNTIGSACQTSPAGYGLWVVSAKIVNNSILFHYPNVRYGSSHNGVGLSIVGNHFEGNNLVSPLITYGDPGTASATVVDVDISHNTFFALTPSAGVPFIGAETPSSGSFTLGASTFEDNIFLSNAGAGAPYLQTNFGPNNKIGLNIAFGSNTPLIPTSFCDSFCASHGFWSLSGVSYNTTDFNNALLALDSTGAIAVNANLTNVAQPLICSNTTSGNAQACNTNPKFIANGGATVTPTTGSTIFYISTQANTGDTTLAVNGLAAVHIRKNNATQTLQAGDITANVYYVLTYDGTYWEMQNQPTTSTLGPLTFAQLPGSPATGTMTYMSDGLAANCADASCTTWGTNVTGGTGALKLLIWYNGAHWTLVGK